MSRLTGRPWQNLPFSLMTFGGLQIPSQDPQLIGRFVIRHSSKRDEAEAHPLMFAGSSTSRLQKRIPAPSALSARGCPRIGRLMQAT
jgi:hypothetical protein